VAYREGYRPINPTAMTERGKEPSDAPRPPSTCPDCACASLTMISDGQFVTVYKCPQCGKLLAPVKRH
jgi:hypothetical protein